MPSIESPPMQCTNAVMETMVQMTQCYMSNTVLNNRNEPKTKMTNEPDISQTNSNQLKLTMKQISKRNNVSRTSTKQYKTIFIIMNVQIPKI